MLIRKTKITKKRVKRSKVIHFYDVALRLPDYRTLHFTTVSQSLPTKMTKILDEIYMIYIKDNSDFNHEDFLTHLKNIGIINTNLKRKTLYLNHVNDR